MKRITLVLLSIVLVGCSKPEASEEIDPDNELGVGTGANSPITGEIGKDGVSVWGKELELVFTDKYTQVDTVMQDRTIIRTVSFLRNDSDSVGVEWLSNGAISEVRKVMQWKGEMQKWLITSAAYIDVGKVASNLRIEVNVQFPDRKVRRLKTIPSIVVKRVVSDIMGFTFGASKAEMPSFSWNEISPKFSLLPFATWSPICEFSNGKLVRLYALNESSYFLTLDSVSSLCRIPQKISYDRDGLTAVNPQEWTFNNLRMKLYNTTLADIVPHYFTHSTRPVACLTIELK